MPEEVASQRLAGAHSGNEEQRDEVLVTDGVGAHTLMIFKSLCGAQT
jgi:hypothetical protein